jgi:hypothetical protein
VSILRRIVEPKALIDIVTYIGEGRRERLCKLFCFPFGEGTFCEGAGLFACLVGGSGDMWEAFFIVDD